MQHKTLKTELRYKNLLSDFNMESLSRRRTLFDLCLIYKILHSSSDAKSLADKFSFNIRPGRHHKITVIGSSTSVRHSHFTIRTIKLWNSLPPSVSQTKKFREFRVGVNQYLDSHGVV